ncbi:restriction endonuclease [Polaribacter sp. BAL334]|uniref:DpnI domain-containing protein n=1 Tax=Polaribacter sp. BAL334 TaxID=1708178 RepID=UPI0018D24FAB|nr:DpnI domain-containing protein [Polaribacter sp. BAL334]MBG7610884.1 restriction endonuclease [Polaribacter sp. BAL334]
MNLNFNTKLATGYSSNSQIARVLTEHWVKENSYCPSCGELSLNEFENNRPVADFYCNTCSEEYELKSKNGKFSTTINDGAYATMIERINSNQNPNFFFLTYSKQWSVENFLIIPKQFFTTEIIIKRNPLSDTAKRAGWIGCNIDISKIATAGKVFLIKNGRTIAPETVKETFHKTLFLRTKNRASKGWILDIMNCVDLIQKDTFTLDEMYQFEQKLKTKYPNNQFIKDKIRQQLQVLRDKDLIEFVSRGTYRKK